MYVGGVRLGEGLCVSWQVYDCQDHSDVEEIKKWGEGQGRRGDTSSRIYNLL